MKLKNFWFIYFFFVFFACASKDKPRSVEVSHTLKRIVSVKEKHSFYRLDAVEDLIFASAGKNGLWVYRIQSNRQVSFVSVFSNEMVFRDVKVLRKEKNRILLSALYYLPNLKHTGLGVFSFSENQLQAFILYQALKDVSAYRICGIETNGNEIRVITADLKQGIQEYLVDTDSKVIVPRDPILLDLPVKDVVSTPTHRYVAAGEGGLLVLEKNGKMKDRYFNDLSSAQKIWVGNKILILADRINGIRFFKLDREGRPEYINQYDTTGDAFDFLVRAGGKELLLADGANGLVWLGIKDPKNPVLYGHFMEIDSLVYDVADSTLFPNWIFVSSGIALNVFELETKTNRTVQATKKKVVK